MSFRITLDSKEFDGFLDNIEASKSRRRNAFKFLSITMENIMKKKAKSIYSSGELDRSILSLSDDKSATVVVMAKHGQIALETGRAPGKTPPIYPLQLWAAKHGMPKTMAFPIAKKIAKQGTKKYRNKGPKLASEAEKEIADYVADNFTKLLLGTYG